MLPQIRHAALAGKVVRGNRSNTTVSADTTLNIMLVGSPSSTRNGESPWSSLGAGITPGALGCRSGFPPIPAGTPEFTLSRSPLTVFLWQQVQTIRFVCQHA